MITGFPSPAQGYETNGIDLNNELIKHPAATVLMRIDSNHYTKMSIYNNDILIIDRAKKVNQNSLVVYESDGEFNLGRVYNLKGETFITGVVTHVIHTVKES